MKVIQYKTFDINQLNLEIPTKNESGNYTCEFKYSDTADFVIQSPEVNVADNGITFKMINKGQFLTLFENLYEKIISLLLVNSKDFFNGKQFSEERLKSSLKKIIYTDQDNVRINNIKISKTVKIFDAFKDTLVLLPETAFNCTCLIELNNLTFDKTECNVNLLITYIKLPLVKKKFTECIFEDEISNESEITQEPEIEKKVVIIQNDEKDLNFFN